MRVIILVKRIIIRGKTRRRGFNGRTRAQQLTLKLVNPEATFERMSKWVQQCVLGGVNKLHRGNKNEQHCKILKQLKIKIYLSVGFITPTQLSLRVYVTPNSWISRSCGGAFKSEKVEIRWSMSTYRFTELILDVIYNKQLGRTVQPNARPADWPSEGLPHLSLLEFISQACVFITVSWDYALERAAAPRTVGERTRDPSASCWGRARPLTASVPGASVGREPRPRTLPRWKLKPGHNIDTCSVKY